MVGTEITAAGATAEGSGSVILWSAPQLTPSAANLLAAGIEPGRNEPWLKPDQVDELRAAIPTLLSGLHQTAAGHISSMMGRLAVVYRAERLSAKEARLRLETYTSLLEDIPPDILRAAFIEAAKTLKFFPTVAEIREIASVELRRRQLMLWRAQYLVRLHEMERPEPEPEPSEEERKEIAQGLRELAQRLGARFPSKRQDRERGPLTPRPHGPNQSESKEDSNGRERGRSGAGPQAHEPEGLPGGGRPAEDGPAPP
jgi:hypothetical protein